MCCFLTINMISRKLLLSSIRTQRLPICMDKPHFGKTNWLIFISNYFFDFAFLYRKRAPRSYHLRCSLQFKYCAQLFRTPKTSRIIYFTPKSAIVICNLYVTQNMIKGQPTKKRNHNVVSFFCLLPPPHSHWPHLR